MGSRFTLHTTQVLVSYGLLPHTPLSGVWELSLQRTFHSGSLWVSVVPHTEISHVVLFSRSSSGRWRYVYQRGCAVCNHPSLLLFCVWIYKGNSENPIGRDFLSDSPSDNTTFTRSNSKPPDACTSSPGRVRRLQQNDRGRRC